mgnify:CR=1 FL=1
MTIDLTVNFLGTKLINPFILCSAPPTKDYESIKKDLWPDGPEQLQKVFL